MSTRRHVFVSFVGGVPDKTRYRFGEAVAASDSSLAGKAIFQHLRETATDETPAPSVATLLGTTGSHWECWYAAPSRAQNELGRKAARDEVGDSDLAPLAGHLADALGVEKCHLKIVPYGLGEAGQLKVLDVLAGLVNAGDVLSLDVTHALRHLPMIALLAAFQLHALKDVRVHGLYYALKDLPERQGGKPGESQVIDLSGLLRIAEWIGALHAFRTDRDYGVFAPLLVQDEMPPRFGDKLRSAAFAQQIQWLDLAETQLRGVKDWLDADRTGGTGALRGISRHFVPNLKQQFEWMKKEGFERQRNLAIDALENGNLWQATLYGFEAFVTRVNERPTDFTNPNPPKKNDKAKAAKPDPTEGDDPGKLRDKRRKTFEESWKHLENEPAGSTKDDSQAYERFRCYRNLQNLRNAVAHGGARKIEGNALNIETDMTKLISDTEHLEDVLRESFRLLLDYEKPSLLPT